MAGNSRRHADVGAARAEGARSAQAASQLLARIPIPFGVALLAMALAVARKPDLLALPQFTNEDGQVYFVGAWLGAGPWTPYGGYLNLIPRVIAWTELAVPVKDAPGLSVLLTLAIAGAVCALLASDLVSTFLPSRLGRFLVAISLILLPATGELLGTLWGLQWILLPVLLLLAYAPFRLWQVPVLLSVALTGPFALFVWPLYLTVTRDRRAVLVIACALIQLAMLATSERFAPRGDLSPSIVASVMALHGLIEPIFGPGNAELVPITIVVPLLGLVAVAIAVQPRKVAWPFVGIAIAIAIAGVIAAPNRGDRLLQPGAGMRYFLLTQIAIGWLAVGAVFSRHRVGRLAGAALIGMAVIGLATSFIVPKLPNLGWAVSAPQCIGSPVACTVPIYPPETWTIRWPGRTEDYEPRPIGW